MQYFILAGGLALLVVAIRLLIKFVSLKQIGIKAEAKVIKVDVRYLDGVAVFIPLIAYYTHHPFRILKELEFSSSDSNYNKVGDTLQIRYDRNDPESFMIDKFPLRNLVLIIAVGLILTTVGLLGVFADLDVMKFFS